MWTSFFRDGGWGMYPTAIFGFALIAASVLLALRPERRFAVLVGTLGLLTLGAGVLGTATGLINTFRYLMRVPEAEQFKIAALGCAESLNNLVFALMLGVLAALLGSIAALRAARANTSVTPAG
jgi:hypothetical protein